nr:hypothetical protein CFP56_33272 [Quercus suber]
MCCNNSSNSEYPQRALSSVPDGSRKLIVSGTLNFDFLASRSVFDLDGRHGAAEILILSKNSTKVSFLSGAI